ncbi:MAG TPA: glycosyltransferase family 4 protein [Candidatus Paceibacterota bacterium]|nr:glycosyltransferase family 4 protein [Candidatus Paceibacterota bacterium]
MKLFYIAAIRLPTEKAHGLQVMKMCEALAAQGADVELLVPRRPNSITADPFAYYGVEPSFRIQALPSLDTSVQGKAGFWLHRLTFSVACAWRLRHEKEGLLYSRDELAIWLLSFFLRLPMVFEAHEGRWNFAVRRASRVCRFLAVISQGLADFFRERGVPENKLLLLPDAADYALFAGAPPSMLRQELGIHADVPLIMYTGHLYAWKGANALAQAASYLPDAFFVFIGGTDQELGRFKAAYGAQKNVRIVGWRPHAELPGHLSTADVLVLPNSAQEDISRLYTSPLKMFEYMAAGKPIVASDLPSIREVLDGETAYFAAPDDPEALAEAIARALADRAGARERASAAQEKAKGFSWAERAASVLKAV